jgi:hypothetical protein
MMQSKSKAEGLEAPWRVAGVSLHRKTEGTGAAALDTPTQEESIMQ